MLANGEIGSTATCSSLLSTKTRGRATTFRRLSQTASGDLEMTYTWNRKTIEHVHFPLVDVPKCALCRKKSCKLQPLSGWPRSPLVEKHFQEGASTQRSLHCAGSGRDGQRGGQCFEAESLLNRSRFSSLSKNISKEEHPRRDFSTALRFGRDDKGEAGASRQSGC